MRKAILLALVVTLAGCRMTPEERTDLWSRLGGSLSWP